MVEGLLVLLYILALLGFMLVVKNLLRRRWWRQENEPQKSLILVVRNQQEMIEGILRRVAQLRNGNATTIELVVIDNGSWDETPRIIARLARYPGGFIFINAASYTGPQETFGLGLEMSRGEKICCFDLQKTVAYYDIYNSLYEVIIHNPHRYFLPRQHYAEAQQRYAEAQQQNGTQVPVENKT